MLYWTYEKTEYGYSILAITEDKICFSFNFPKKLVSETTCINVTEKMIQELTDKLESGEIKIHTTIHEDKLKYKFSIPKEIMEIIEYG